MVKVGDRLYLITFWPSQFEFRGCVTVSWCEQGYVRVEEIENREFRIGDIDHWRVIYNPDCHIFRSEEVYLKLKREKERRDEAFQIYEGLKDYFKKNNFLDVEKRLSLESLREIKAIIGGRHGQ